SKVAQPVGSFVAGEWLPVTDALVNVNPSDLDSPAGEHSRGVPEEVDMAVAAAKTAFRSWSETTPYARHGILRRIAEALFARATEIGRELSLEEGKILAEGIGEVQRAAQIFEF